MVLSTYMLHNKREIFIVNVFRQTINRESGKMKFKINLDVSLKVDEIKSSLRNDPRLDKFLVGREIKKIIVVPGKIINIVC